MPGVILALLATSRQDEDQGKRDRKPARGRPAKRKTRRARTRNPR